MFTWKNPIIFIRKTRFRLSSKEAMLEQ